MKKIEIEILEQPDLKVGMFVTVAKWKPYSNGIEDQSYRGEKLKIVKINYPIVYCDVIDWDKNITLWNIRLSLDMVYLITYKERQEQNDA